LIEYGLKLGAKSYFHRGFPPRPQSSPFLINPNMLRPPVALLPSAAQCPEHGAFWSCSLLPKAVSHVILLLLFPCSVPFRWPFLPPRTFFDCIVLRRRRPLRARSSAIQRVHPLGGRIPLVVYASALVMPLLVPV